MEDISEKKQMNIAIRVVRLNMYFIIVVGISNGSTS
jgi:hypothetical protein